MAHDAAARSPGLSPTLAAVDAPMACAWCGALAPNGEQPLTWTSSVEGNGAAAVTKLYCDRCSRDHLRDIESKLDAPWW